MVLNIISIECNTHIFSVSVKIGNFYYYTEVSDVKNAVDFVVIISNLFLYYAISFADISMVFYNIHSTNYLCRNIFYIILYGIFFKKNVILCNVKSLCFFFYFSILKNDLYHYFCKLDNSLIFFYVFRFKNIIIKKEVSFGKFLYLNKGFYYRDVLIENCSDIQVRYTTVGIFSVLFGVNYKLKKFILN